MKYWNDSEAEHIQYKEGTRIMPYKHPASVVSGYTHYGKPVQLELELVPNTAEVRDVVSYTTFETEYRLCVKVERRRWQENGELISDFTWIPLDELGYDKEPISSRRFDEAMKIL